MYDIYIHIYVDMPMFLYYSITITKSYTLICWIVLLSAFSLKKPNQYRLMAWRRKSKSVSVKAELCSSEATPMPGGCVWSKAKPITASPGGVFHSKIKKMLIFGDAKPVIFGLTQKSLKPIRQSETLWMNYSTIWFQSTFHQQFCQPFICRSVTLIWC